MLKKLGFKPEDRVLIIQADDFGMTEGTNQAVLRLLQEEAV